MPAVEASPFGDLKQLAQKSPIVSSETNISIPDALDAIQRGRENNLKKFLSLLFRSGIATPIIERLVEEGTLLFRSKNTDCYLISIITLILGGKIKFPDEYKAIHNMNDYVSLIEVKVPTHDGMKIVTSSKSLLEWIDSRMNPKEDSIWTSKLDELREQYEITCIPQENGNFILIFQHKDNDSKYWKVECKLRREEITDLFLSQLIPVLEKFPTGATASLQVDTHNAGHIFVGMVCSCEVEDGVVRIPIVVVSADIGCGLALLPIVKDGVQLSSLSKKERMQVLIRARRVLARGKVSDDGKTKIPTHLISNVMKFYGRTDMLSYLSSFYELLIELDLITDAELSSIIKKERTRVTEIIEQNDLSGADNPERLAATLLWISGYGCTLGSSGNHFLEISSMQSNAFMVVHSGSRALGGIIYKKIMNLTFLAGTDGIATGVLAHLYSRAYDLLNTFAQINRLLCALAVAESMGWETDPSILRATLLENPLFSSVREAFTVEDSVVKATNALLVGITHNGVKAFREFNPVTGETIRILFTCVKGAVVVSKRASTVIVALKMGEGCAVFTYCNPSVYCEEIPLTFAQKEIQNGIAYSTDLPSWEGLISLHGHGAGRCCSASKNFERFTWMDLRRYLEEMDVLANMGQGLLPDHPSGYKPAEIVMRTLPPNAEQLRTLMGWKECISFQKKHVEAFKSYLSNLFDEEMFSDYHVMSTEEYLLLGQIDWNLIRHQFNKRDDFARICAVFDKVTAYWLDE